MGHSIRWKTKVGKVRLGDRVIYGLHWLPLESKKQLRKHSSLAPTYVRTHFLFGNDHLHPSQ